MHFTLSDFDYHLPERLIAQFPKSDRSGSRLMIVPFGKNPLSCEHTQFKMLGNHLRPGDLLVFNDTKVIPARLIGKKATGGQISCLIERIVSPHRALAHIRASHAPGVDAVLTFDPDIQAKVIAKKDHLYELLFLSESPILEVLEAHGDIPLPPYIERMTNEEDKQRYQTVYAKYPGAVAAPTAGLHFDAALIDDLKNKGINTAFVTLHVGAGTFQPVRTENLEEHVMHAEMITVNQDVCDLIQTTKANNGRVIAVGTTVVRALETASLSGQIQPYQGDSQLFIRPGFNFHCIDALITNFHLPKSSLLMLVSALAGYERIKWAYAEAIANAYRFFSYGMLLCPSNTQ
jgi:S-adenosylmethionine:tRNA ribosyltransferase-isomerase